MNVATLLQTLDESAAAAAIRDNVYLFPAIETVHVIALTLVFGTIFIVDLRILGAAWIDRRVRQVEADTLKWTWAGFALAVLTGSLMFLSNAQVYARNLPFLVKLILLAAAGLNLLVFQFASRRKVEEWDTARTAPLGARIAAMLSILLWTGVIVSGRWIGFTTRQDDTAIEAPSPDMDFDALLDGGPGAPPLSDERSPP